MGEARRRKARGEYPRCEVTVRRLPPGELPKDVRRIFFGEDCEPITRELLSDLLAEGWNPRDLEEAVQLGAVYCQPRRSLLLMEGVEYAMQDGEAVLHCHALIPREHSHAA